MNKINILSGESVEGCRRRIRKDNFYWNLCEALSFGDGEKAKFHAIVAGNYYTLLAKCAEISSNFLRHLNYVEESVGVEVTLR